MIRGVGTNNAANTQFIDSSSNNLTITRVGNTTQGSFSPFSTAPGYWSNYFDGSGDYLSVPANAALNLTTNDFTIEAWVFITAGQTGGAAIIAGGIYGPYVLYFNAAQTLVFYAGSNGNSWAVDNLNVATTLTTNTWHHVAITRSGSTFSSYLNGSRVAQATSSASLTSNVTTNIGYYSASLAGYISNLRIVKGSSVYNGATYTVPTAPLTAISGTSLLTCQSNRFADGSSNTFSITPVGNTSASTFGPFTPASTYNAATMGGSAYFDGSGDYLTVATSSNFGYGTGDFTIEFWLYLNSTAQQTIISNLTDVASVNPHLYVDSATSTIRYYTNSADRIVSSVVSAGQWYHVALSRASGSTRLFINGTQSGSTYSDSNDYGSTAPFSAGTYFSGGSPVANLTLNGYISNLRVVKGSAVYTSSFTLPTAPVPSISGTSLLLNGTNSGVVDASAKNVLDTVGDAKISTAQSKWGTSSLYFDGTGDYLTATTNPNYAFGTGNFTVECWVYPADVSGAAQRGILQTSTSVGGLQASYSNGIVIYFGARLNGGGNGLGNVATINGGLLAIVNDTVVGSTSTSAIASVNQWQHIALVRNNGTLTLYFNGTSIGSVASSANITAQNLCVGGYYNTAYLYNGYMNDLRISKGIARYTANFTPPTAL